jgi:hypothetical protein
MPGCGPCSQGIRPPRANLASKVPMFWPKVSDTGSRSDGSPLWSFKRGAALSGHGSGGITKPANIPIDDTPPGTIHDIAAGPAVLARVLEAIRGDDANPRIPLKPSMDHA